jgi:tRNA(Glu) U13 pseudouridine synthase TruD
VMWDSDNLALEKYWGLEWWPPSRRPSARIPRPEGFLVAEPRPLYWKGEWTLYYVRKVNLPTETAARALARRLGAKAYSYYGLKDTNAVAFQHIALLHPRWKPEHIVVSSSLEAWLISENVSKPVKGFQGWNAFRIILVGDELDCRKPGPFPNYYGPQRFGVCNVGSHEIGILLATGRVREAERLLGGRLDTFTREISLQALQSYVWNKALSRALKESWPRVNTPRSGLLSCPRHATNWRMPLLPLPSPVRAGPEWWERLVDDVLSSLGLGRDHLKGLRPRWRPALAVACTSYCFKKEDGEIRYFTLPRGVYATVFLRSFYRIDWLEECGSRVHPKLTY